MFRRTIALLALLAIAVVVPAQRSDAILWPRPNDLIVFGSDEMYQGPTATISRVSHNGQIVWSKPVAGVTQQVSLNYRGADRNVTEESFYIAVSLYGENLLNGKGQLQKYDMWGNLAWAIGIDGYAATQEYTVSANPVKGGVFVATWAGVYRIAPNGSIVWGPLDFGLGLGSWQVGSDTRDGGAYVTHYDSSTVLKITAAGTPLWSTSVYRPQAPLYSPKDRGVYIGSGSYAYATYKLSSAGVVQWSRVCFPSCFTYGRAVDPIDGSLYVTSGWDGRIGRISPTGVVLADVYMNDGWGPIANQGLAVSLNGYHLYTGNSVDQLGVDDYWALKGSTMTRNWHVNPGWYVMPGSVYNPLYRPYVGMPRSR